jgi:hypothetical protein
MRNSLSVFVGNMKGREHMEERDFDGRIVLKRFLQK